MGSKEVGFYQGATELLGFHYSNDTSKSSCLFPQKCDIGDFGRKAAMELQKFSLKIALCACNPPVVCVKIVALCDPHLLAVTGAPIDSHKQSENRKVEL